MSLAETLVQTSGSAALAAAELLAALGDEPGDAHAAVRAAGLRS